MVSVIRFTSDMQASTMSWLFWGIALQTRDWYAPLFLYAAVFVIPAIVLGWIGLQ